MKSQLHPNPATEEVAVENDIDSMTVTELKAECKARGIEGYSDMKKSELIGVLSRK